MKTLSERIEILKSKYSVPLTDPLKEGFARAWAMPGYGPVRRYIQDALAAGITFNQLLAAGITVNRLLDGGITVNRLLDGGVTFNQLLDGKSDDEKSVVLDLIGIEK